MIVGLDHLLFLLKISTHLWLSGGIAALTI